jgi:hypothetical protein
MGRPRKWASETERQRAYRAKKKPANAGAGEGDNAEAEGGQPARAKGCAAYAPRGTRCKICGQVHPLT